MIGQPTARGKIVNEVPPHLVRYPTRAGRYSLAARLGLSISDAMQDWEWEIADPAHFDIWLSSYRCEPLSSDDQPPVT